MTTFGDRLKAARAAAKLTQEALGFAVGVSKQAVSDWENGRQFPNPQAWPLLRKALPISLDELICGEGLQGIQRVQEESAAYIATLGEDERAVLTGLNRMNAAERAAMVGFFKAVK